MIKLILRTLGEKALIEILGYIITLLDKKGQLVMGERHIETAEKGVYAKVKKYEPK